MGRGRAKAKQTKVARRLKYTTTGTDLDRLKEELSAGGGLPSTVDEPDDDYAAYTDADDEDDEDDDEDAALPR